MCGKSRAIYTVRIARNRIEMTGKARSPSADTASQSKAIQSRIYYILVVMQPSTADMTHDLT